MSTICTIPQQPDITRMKITLLIHLHYLVVQFEASRLVPILIGISTADVSVEMLWRHICQGHEYY